MWLKTAEWSFWYAQEDSCSGSPGTLRDACPETHMLELLVWLALRVALVLAGQILQAIGKPRDARRFPPPGQLVDLGSHRLHISPISPVPQGRAGTC